MGSIKKSRHGFGFFAVFSYFILSIVFLNPLYGQTGYSLASEISRLEKLSQGSSSSQDRYNAFCGLVRLHQLSGNPEAALQCCTSALGFFPGDGRLLAEQARLLISQGEFEKAMTAVNVLKNNAGDRDFSILGRFLEGQLQAFQSGSTENLSLLADNPDFIEYRIGIYYTLWKLTDLPSWKTRLVTEFPQSTEAKIASGTSQGSGQDFSLALSPTPLWILFPGRGSLVLSTPVVAQGAAPSSSQTTVLQTGVFGREDNAKTMGERLQKEGFTPQITKRTVNGSDYWAVSVGSGADMNETIKKLKDLGYEAFPVY